MGGMNRKGETFILSLGGSIVVPNGGIDTHFLSAFNHFIRNQVSKKHRKFFIVVGGGTTAKTYINAGKKILGHNITKDNQDWLGIYATRLNAQLVHTLFRDIAHPHVIEHYKAILKIDKSVAVAAGWRPGWSTDYDAVILCQKYGIQGVVNMGNVDKIYTKDPKKFADAKSLDTISWKAYRKIVGDKWSPRMNVPFDPIAAELASELKIVVRYVNGKNLDNLALVLDNKLFVGTTISS